MALARDGTDAGAVAQRQFHVERQWSVQHVVLAADDARGAGRSAAGRARDRIRRIHGVQRRDRRHVGVRGCAGGVGQLFRHARYRSRRRPPARRLGRSARRRAGSRHQPRVLAAALRRPRRRHRQGDGSERDACHDRRGIPRRLSRHTTGRRRTARDGAALASRHARAIAGLRSGR